MLLTFLDLSDTSYRISIALDAPDDDVEEAEPNRESGNK